MMKKTSDSMGKDLTAVSCLDVAVGERQRLYHGIEKTMLQMEGENPVVTSCCAFDLARCSKNILCKLL